MSAARRLRRWWRPALAALVFLAACEAVAWAALGGRGLSPAVFRPAAGGHGQRLQPDASSRVRLLGRNVVVSVDADGHRRTIGVPPPAASAVPVHLIGDSQVFGWGLADDETIASRVQAELGPGFRVLNHGIPGTGPLAYQAELAGVASGEWTVVVHTEENDLWDAYGMVGGSSVQCGHLAPVLAGGFHLPCLVLDSRSFQVAARLYDSLYYRHRPAPIGYHPYAAVATSVLLHRTRGLYDQAREERGPRLVFTYVPWVGRYAPDRLDTYFPPPLPSRQPIGFPDDCAMEAAFVGGGRGLYLDGDSHLSPEGAGRLAGAVARELKRRMLRPSTEGRDSKEAAS